MPGPNKHSVTNWWGSCRLISPFHFSEMSLSEFFLEAFGGQGMMSPVREMNAEKDDWRIKKDQIYGTRSGEGKQRQRQIPFMQILL